MKNARWGVVAVALVLTGCGLTPSKPAPSAPASPPLAPASITLPATQDPAALAPQVVRYAREAGVDPQLLMAILYNESYKPHDPDSERAWQKIKPDAAFGVANMHEATFDQTKQGRPFAKRAWQELPDDPGLAIEAAAWYLHDLNAQLPSSHPQYTGNELLALGYNAGPGNMKAFAKGTKPGSDSQSYLDRLHDNWDKAARALSHA
ncbi:transglycosylase SLT domain-containing protein [Amycolatopsis pigmentata]|uniref:Transglycosylase SLT domain-containing protein n=1 Tax=Amycolatopsis pigmentata TaxID=450801 RepID=A0ABW5G299_9PSEU